MKNHPLVVFFLYLVGLIGLLMSACGGFFFFPTFVTTIKHSIIKHENNKLYVDTFIIYPSLFCLIVGTLIFYFCYKKLKK
jgi:hypothetical protein